MKLNLDILHDCLQSKYTVHCFGPEKKELYLGRPILFESGHTMESDKLYVSRSDILPNEVPDKNVTVISVGGIITKEWYSGNANVLAVTNETSFFKIFNEIQLIYDTFDAWDNDLQQVLNSSDLDILQLIKIGVEMIQNPFFFTATPSMQVVLSSELTTQSDGKLSVRVSDLPYPIPEEETIAMKEVFTLEHLIKTPYFSDWPLNRRIYCFNVYQNDYYKGCAIFEDRHRPFRQADFSLADHFFSYFQKAYFKYLYNAEKVHSVSTTALQNLLQHLPLNTLEHIQLTLHENERWICFKLLDNRRKKTLPLDYMSTTLNIMMQDLAYSITRGTSIVGILRVSSKEVHGEGSTLTRFQKLLVNMEYVGGVSENFENLQKIDDYFLQAEYATKMHLTNAVNGPLAYFQDYLLEYMLHTSVEKLPIELLCSVGIRRLQEYDAEKNTELLKTLDQYLQHETNGAKTAEALYIHRSSLQKRLDRIVLLTGDNFDDPDTNLYYRLYLRLLKNS